MTAETIKNMDTVDIILGLEGGDLLDDIDSVEKAQAVLDKVSCLRQSQGFYTRLCNALEEYIARGEQED